MSKSTNGLRKVGLASLAVTLTLGAGLAGAGAANAVEDFKFDRIAGADRFDTAKKVSVEFKSLQAYDEVILVNGQRGQYADALAAAHLAGDRQIPILLTKHTETPDFTVEALEANAVKKITIVGGEGVVSAEQEAALKADGYDVTRIAGIDRYKTNAEVLEAAGTTTATTGLVAAGNNFADALAGSPVAYKGSPLGLAKVDDIDDDVKKALVDSGIKTVVILGGPTIVGPEVEAELKAAGLTVERVYGADRSETSMELADYAIEKLGMTDKAANVASGSSTLYGADALSGGPLTGEENRPMLITMNVDKPGDLESWFEAHANTLEEGIIFGGNGAVSTRVQELLEAAASKTTSNQDFTATPSGAQSVEDGSVVQFNFSGIESDTVSVRLFDCSNVSTDQNGTTTFSGTNPGGAGNVAQQDGTVNSDITVVNGAVNTGGGVYEADVNSADGTVDFSVDTTGAGGECFVAVVWDDADGDDLLDLGADNRPTEAFGNSGDVTVLFDEAGEGAFSVAVDDVNKDADYFQSTSNAYYYDANDEFLLEGGSNPDTTITMAEFEQRLSAGDGVSGNYRTNSANQSTFLLDDTAPTPPTVEAAENTTDGGVLVTLTKAGAADDGIDAYRVYRALANDNITPVPSDCNVAASAYSLIGTVTNDTTKDTETYKDTTASASQEYCYAATSVDGTDEGPRGFDSTPVSGGTATAQSAPEFTGAAVTGGTSVVTVDYDELVQCDTVDSNGSNYAVSIINSDGSQTGLTEVSAECVSPALSGTEQADNQVEITVSETIPATAKVVVRAVNGADANTVLDLDAVAQPTSDAVQATAS